MSDADRRFDRESPEEPLTIDSRRRARPPRGPAPVALIVSLIVLIAVVGAAFYLYRSGVRGSNDAPQPLGAPLGDVRAPAPPQAQTSDPSAGLTISKDDPNAATAPPTLAPPPEQPLPEPAARSTKTLPPPPPPPPQSPAMVDPDTPVMPVAPPARPIPGTTADKSASPADADGAVVVQIGAFSSQQLADREWSMAAAIAPGAMAGKGKRVVPVAKNGATLYRTAITGFTSREQAASLCEKLKAAGGSCFVH
jgi:outer membrane biosynthesis protein TonB